MLYETWESPDDASAEQIHRPYRRAYHEALADLLARPREVTQWHTLRAEFSGQDIKVLLNGKQYIARQDSHISGPGAVGVWTKSDSVTAFDDFSFDGK